jgi:HK97 family phage prohead protease
LAPEGEMITNCRGRLVKRSNLNGYGNSVGGYAAVFHRRDVAGTQYELAADVVERIDRNAFTRAIEEEHDVRVLVDHDPSLIIGRTSAGTAKLSVDDIGLYYEAELPDSPNGQNIRASIRRGDVNQSSFAFKVLKQEFTLGKDGEPEVRLIQDVQLFDCSAVTHPAYRATSVG